MRTIVAGSRTILDYQLVERVIDNSNITPSVIISGTAGGVDSLGERYADEHNIQCERFPANWKRFKNSAGYIRNCAMGDNADALIAIWDGRSNGTKHMINTAQKKGLQITLCLVDQPEG